MTLARFSFGLIGSILLLLVVGNPEAASTTMALATNAPMPAKEIGASLRQKKQHQNIRCLCCGASGRSFRQITTAASFQDNRFCICKLLEISLASSESCSTEATCRFVLWSSSATFVNDAETLRKPCFVKPSTCTPAAPSFGRTPLTEIKAIGDRETMQQARLERSAPQSNQLAETANVEPGFALSELTGGRAGARWQVPEEFYDHLR